MSSPGVTLSKRSRVLALVGLLVAGVVAGGLVASRGGGWQEDCPTDPNGVIECPAGKRPPAPTVRGELLDGGQYDLAQARGQVVVVNFWGSWCAPCRAEADDLEGTYQATKAAGVTFIGVNTQDDRDKARSFERGRVSYPSIFDPGNRVGLDFDLPPSATPSTIILDRQGQIAVAVRRSTVASELRPLVERVAAEQPGTR